MHPPWRRSPDALPSTPSTTPYTPVTDASVINGARWPQVLDERRQLVEQMRLRCIAEEHILTRPTAVGMYHAIEADHVGGQVRVGGWGGGGGRRAMGKGLVRLG